MWLDPMPWEEDMPQAYRSYYTHSENDQNKNRTLDLFTISRQKLLLFLLRLTPLYRERKDINQMYLGKIKPGRLLAIGCGNGMRLAPLADVGWSIEGQEIDPISAAIASKNGIMVHLGSLEDINLPAASYDAIVMNHVIEHVYDPIKLLVECQRLLSSNGVLVAVTPNINSYGHRTFKMHWRGLEPPRHMILHGQKSLRHLAQRAGFKNPVTWTTAANAHHFALDSLKIMRSGIHLNVFSKALLNFRSKLFLLTARVVQAFDKDSGEECVLMLKKDG